MKTLAPLLVFAAWLAAGEDDSPSAFRFRIDDKVKLAIDPEEIHQGVRGADPRDKIPAIRKPRHQSAAKAAEWLRDDEQVLGIVVGEEARAYPLRVLEVHEMVNDVLDGRPIGPNY